MENTRSQKDYGLLNAKVGYEGDRFDFYLYGRNLLDEEYATRQVRSGGNWAGRAGEPLVVGNEYYREESEKYGYSRSFHFNNTVARLQSCFLSSAVFVNLSREIGRASCRERV